MLGAGFGSPAKVALTETTTTVTPIFRTRERPSVSCGQKFRSVSMDNLWGESYDWSTFPVWRKVLIGCFMVLSFIVGYQLFSEETDIYTTAPDIPVMETKQVVPVHVNHSN